MQKPREELELQSSRTRGLNYQRQAHLSRFDLTQNSLNSGDNIKTGAMSALSYLAETTYASQTNTSMWPNVTTDVEEFPTDSVNLAWAMA